MSTLVDTSYAGSHCGKQNLGRLQLLRRGVNFATGYLGCRLQRFSGAGTPLESGGKTAPNPVK